MLAVLLLVSFIVNIKLMKSDEAKAVATAGNYERYDEAVDEVVNETDDEAVNETDDETVNMSGSKKHDLITATEPSDEEVEKEVNSKSSSSVSVATTRKTPNVVTQGTVKQSSNGPVVIGDKSSTARPKTDTKYKPEESTQEGERKKLKEFIGEAWNHSGDRYLYVLYQNPDYSKKIKVTVQVDYLSIFDEGVECNDERFRDRLNTDGYIIHPCEVECYQGENCWDAIARALIYYEVQYSCDAEPFKHGFEMDNQYGTCYLSCCDNMYAGVNAEGKTGPFGNSMSGWTYTVTNATGKTVYPGLGMNGVLVKDGDILRLKYHNGLESFSLDEYGNF